LGEKIDMPIRTRIDPINRNVAAIVNATLSPQAQSETVAEFAREVLAEAEAQNAAVLGTTPAHDTFVDGVAEAPLESVHVPGNITFVFRLLTELFAYVADMLDQHSPVLTGRYKRSNIFFADGQEADPRSPPPATEYVFLNVQPYARKIEGASKPPESPQAPEGVYEGVATLANGRFGNLARIAFGYRAPMGGESELEDWASSTRQVRRAGRTGSTSSWNRNQPAIIITVR
jgi:hypothetical protein